VRKSLVAYADAGAVTPVGSGATRMAPGAAGTAGTVARLIENMLPALGSDDVRFSGQAAPCWKPCAIPPSDSRRQALLANFNLRLSFAAETSRDQVNLLKLLHLIVENFDDTLDENGSSVLSRR